MVSTFTPKADLRFNLCNSICMVDPKPFYQSYRQLQLQQYQSTKYNALIDKCLELKQYLNQSVRDANTWTLDLCIGCTNNDVIYLKVSASFIGGVHLYQYIKNTQLK